MSNTFPILDTVQGDLLDYAIAKLKTLSVVNYAVEHGEVRALIHAQLSQVNDVAAALSDAGEDDELEVLASTMTWLGTTIMFARLGWDRQALVEELDSYLEAGEDGIADEWIAARDVGSAEAEESHIRHAPRAAA